MENVLSHAQIKALPERKAYRAIVRKLFDDNLRTKGTTTRPSKERTNIIKAAELHEAIRNGGIAHYFTSPLGREYSSALEALQALGAVRQFQTIRNWLSCLPRNVEPSNLRSVGTRIFDDPILTPKLDNVDQEYFDAVDSFYETVVKYVLANWNNIGLE